MSQVDWVKITVRSVCKPIAAVSVEGLRTNTCTVARVQAKMTAVEPQLLKRVFPESITFEDHSTALTLVWTTISRNVLKYISKHMDVLVEHMSSTHFFKSYVSKWVTKSLAWIPADLNVNNIICMNTYGLKRGGAETYVRKTFLGFVNQRWEIFKYVYCKRVWWDWHTVCVAGFAWIWAER